MKIELNGKSNFFTKIISSLMEFLLVSLFVWFLFQLKSDSFNFIPEINYKDAMWIALIMEVLVWGFKDRK